MKNILFFFVFFVFLSSLFSNDTVFINFSSDSFIRSRKADSVVAISLWFKNFAKNQSIVYNLKTKIIEWETLGAELNKGPRTGLIFMPIMTYLRTRTSVKLNPVIYVSYNSENRFERLNILVNRKVRNLSELKNRQIVILEETSSNIGKYWFRNVIKTSGLKYEDFSANITSDKSSLAILQLYFNKISACVVSETDFATMTELNPKVGRNLVVLKRSPKFIMGVGCSLENTDKKICEDFKRITKNLMDSVEGKQLSELFRIAKMGLIDEGDLKNIEDLFNSEN